MPVVASSYTPPPFLSGGHVQTLVASLMRQVDFTYDRRERLDTPDDDFLDLDWAVDRSNGTNSVGSNSRVAVLTHGLEGSARRCYMCGMARAFLRRGRDVCAWNLRGCSGETNHCVATYHSGKTDDLSVVIEHVLERGYSTVGLIGFSLGGNLTLKYLGEQGSTIDDRIRGAVTFSVPIDLDASAHQIDRWSNWHYSKYFLRSLRQTIQAKAEQHPDTVSTDPLDNIRTLRGFDDAYTAPLHDFKCATDYYQQASSKPFLSRISVPTLLVNAANDPFLADTCYPYTLARQQEHLTLEVPDSGGHVGFISYNDRGEYWSERRATSFLGSR